MVPTGSISTSDSHYEVIISFGFEFIKGIRSISQKLYIIRRKSVYHQPGGAVSHHALAGILLAARSCFNYEPENIDFTNCAIDLKIFLKNAPIVAKKPFFEVLLVLDPGSFKGVFPSLRSVK